MASRRFNKSEADKELEALRAARPSFTAPPPDAAAATGTACGATGAGIGTMGMGMGTLRGALGGTSSSSSASATNALYNVLLRGDFDPSDAQPVLNKGLAVQIKELRRLETAALAEAEAIDDYRYDDGKALRDRLLGLDAVDGAKGSSVGLLPRRVPTRDTDGATDDGGGVGWEGESGSAALQKKDAPAVSQATAMGVDADGNMACGTDDLEAFIRSQQRRGGGSSSLGTVAATVRTVSEVPRTVAEMAIGAVLEDLIDQFAVGGGASSSRPPSAVSRAGLPLFATSARGPAISAFQNTLAAAEASSAESAQPRRQTTSAASGGGFTPSPPRAGRPQPGSASAATRPTASAAAPFGHDIYSLKPSTSGSGVPTPGLGSLRGLRAPSSGGRSSSQAGRTIESSGGASSSANPLRSRMGLPVVPLQPTNGISTRGGPLGGPATPAGASGSNATVADATAAEVSDKLFIHTHYLGSNTIAFCPTCRHCVDVALLRREQGVEGDGPAAMARLVCPRCGERWVDKALVAEQRQAEDEEAAEFQRAVMEWRRAARGGGDGGDRGTPKEPSDASGGGGVGVGTDSAPLKKGVHIPKGLYFQHLWRCIEAPQQ